MALRTVSHMLRTSTRSASRSKVIFQHLRMSSVKYSTSADDVLLTQTDDKGIIQLNRPKALNSLNLSMVRKIHPKLKAWEGEDDMSMVLIKGAGDKAFCAGGDVRAMTDAGRLGDRSLGYTFFKEEYILNNAIGTLSIPYVALIDGITMGGGVGLSVHGTFRVATERTMFAMPETAIGLIPDVGGGYILPRLGGKLGIYLALTGFRLKARDIQKAGIATHFVHSSKLGDLEKELLALPSPNAQEIGVVLDDYHQQSLEYSDKEFALQPHMENIDRLFAGETMEEIFKALEEDGSEWATKQLNTLKKMSPVSMKITLRQLQNGQSMSLQDVLQMEYRLTYRCMEDHDFYEGVRAVLVDKDNSPKWKPAELEGITEEKLKWYFSPLPEGVDLVLKGPNSQ